MAAALDGGSLLDVKLITLRYCPVLGAFDETPLVEAARGGALVELREHFFETGGVAHLACLLLLRRPGNGSDEPPGPARPNPVRGLDEGQRAIFEQLRVWRNAQAREEGVPPYILFSNRELAGIAKARPTSPTALSNVEGVGPAKIERYGVAVLELLREKQ